MKLLPFLILLPFVTLIVLKKVIQTHDVDLDYRGLIYITDRAGAGLHILEYTGSK